MRLAGIDGCSTGWVAVVAGAESLASAVVRHVRDLRGFLAQERIDLAVIDMPIGLVAGPDARDVEPALRARLRGKASSVFPAPCRAALAEQTYADASAVNARVLGRRLTRQTFNLFPKLREVDQIARTPGPHRLSEGHPELSFALLNGTPVLSRKRIAAGQADRIALLQGAGFAASGLLDGLRRGLMAVDDILDAAALLWSADRWARDQHLILPPVPSRDAVGLQMSVIA